MEQQLAELQGKLKRLKDYYLVQKTRKNDLEKRKKELTKACQLQKEKLETLEKVRALLQETAEFSREQAKQQMEWLVTSALQAVFGGEISFKIELRPIKNRMEADFFVISNYEGVEVKVRPEQSRGGGVVDIVALALRFAMIHLFKPSVEGPIILDEPAKHVSEEYIGQVAEFLHNISAGFDRQIIMVTHNNYLSEIADTAYRVELKNGQSTLAKIK